MIEISKKDWKLFRDKIAIWQENFIDRLNKEYIELLEKDAAASDKFWELEERIKKDRKRPGVILDMRRSEMIYQLLALLQDEVISLDDLEEFSSDLQETVKFLMERWC